MQWCMRLEFRPIIQNTGTKSKKFNSTIPIFYVNVESIADSFGCVNSPCSQKSTFKISNWQFLPLF